MTTLPVSQEAYVAAIEAMRSPDVTSANAATTWARATFANLMVTNDDGTFPFTIDMAIAAVCAVYKPKTNKGKLGTTIGSLKDGGFPAIADRLNTVKRIASQMGVEGVKPLIAAFVASTAKTDSFAKLASDVKDAVKAAAPKPVASEGDGEAEAEAEAEAAAPIAPVTVSLADKLAFAAATVANMTDAEVSENFAAIDHLWAMVVAAREAHLADVAAAPVAKAA